MKRTLSFLLALLFLSACSGISGTSGDSAAPPAKAGALSPGELSAEEQAEPRETKLNLKETQNLPFAEFTLESADILRRVGGEGRNATYHSAPDGKRFFAVSGPISNKHTSAIQLSNIVGEVVFDDTYTFTLNVTATQGNYLNSKMEPFAEGKLVFYAEIPEEYADTFTKATVRFGFDDAFEKKPADLASAAHVYSIETSKEESAKNPIDTHPFVPVKLKLKESIKAKSVTISFSKVELLKKMRVKYKNSTYSYFQTAGTQALCLVGTIKNTGKKAIKPEINGYVIIDGNQYEVQDWLVGAKSFKVPAKGSCKVYLFAELPSAVAKKLKTAEFYFGFNDGFTNTAFTPIEECQYAYSLTYKKTNK